MTRRLRRTASAFAVGTALLALLSACYVGPASAESCAPASTAGTSSGSVEASGAVGSQPTVTFPTPLHPTKTESTTLDKGKGKLIRPGQYVSTLITFLNGSTGEVIGQSDYSAAGSPQIFSLASPPLPGLANGIECTTVGSRVATVIPGKVAFKGTSAPAGMSPDDAVVAVIDIEDAYLAHAQGYAQVTQNGLPAVVLAPNGQPGITVPKADPPTKLRVAKLIEGDGAKVKDGETVLVNYTGVIWDTNVVFDSSWDAGKQPLSIKVEDGQAITGFIDGLKGAKVGDQILMVIPPKDAYGDKAQGSVPANSTLVFVVDVLGIVK